MPKANFKFTIRDRVFFQLANYKVRGTGIVVAMKEIDDGRWYELACVELTENSDWTDRMKECLKMVHESEMQFLIPLILK